jgi:hypothetical protein
MDDEMPPLVASDSECDDEDENGQSDSSSNTEAIVAAQPLIAWRLLSDAFMRWMRYDDCETDDSVDDDDWDEWSAAGSVQGYSWRSQLDVKYLPIWSRSQVHLTIGSGAFVRRALVQMNILQTPTVIQVMIRTRMMLIRTPTVMQVMTRVRMMMGTQVMTRLRMMMGIQVMIRDQLMLQTRVIMIVRSPFGTTGISA